MYKQTHYLQRTPVGNTENYKNRQNNSANLPITYIDNLISPDNSTNPKRLYSYINDQRKDQSGIQQLQDKDDSLDQTALPKPTYLTNTSNQYTPKTRTIPPYQTKALAHIHPCSTLQ